MHEHPPLSNDLRPLSWMHTHYNQVMQWAIIAIIVSVILVVYDVGIWGMISYLCAIILFFYAKNAHERFQPHIKISKSIYSTIILLASMFGMRFAAPIYAACVLGGIVITYTIFCYFIKVHICHVCRIAIRPADDLITYRPSTLLDIEIYYFHTECYDKFKFSNTILQHQVNDVIL